jgi:hypothetical protein
VPSSPLANPPAGKTVGPSPALSSRGTQQELVTSFAGPSPANPSPHNNLAATGFPPDRHPCRSATAVDRWKPSSYHSEHPSLLQPCLKFQDAWSLATHTLARPSRRAGLANLLGVFPQELLISEERHTSENTRRRKGDRSGQGCDSPEMATYKPILVRRRRRIVPEV